MSIRKDVAINFSIESMATCNLEYAWIKANELNMYQFWNEKIKERIKKTLSEDN